MITTMRFILTNLPDSKKFYLIGSNIDYIMKSLDDRIVVDMYSSD